jgi:hypothetical protein
MLIPEDQEVEATLVAKLPETRCTGVSEILRWSSSSGQQDPGVVVLVDLVRKEACYHVREVC